MGIMCPPSNASEGKGTNLMGCQCVGMTCLSLFCDSSTQANVDFVSAEITFKSTLYAHLKMEGIKAINRTLTQCV